MTQKYALHPVLHSSTFADTKPNLQGILEEVCLLSLVGVNSPVLCSPGSSLSVSLGLASILALEVPPHECSEEGSKEIVAEEDCVSLEVTRSILLGIDERADAATGITQADDKGSADTLLEGSSDVVGTERDDQGNERVSTSCS